MPPLFCPRPNPFHPIKTHNRDRDADEDDAYIDIHPTYIAPPSMNIAPYNTTPATSPIATTNPKRCPDNPNANTPSSSKNQSTFIDAVTSPIAKPSHHHTSPFRQQNQHLLPLHSLPVPLFPYHHHNPLLPLPSNPRTYQHDHDTPTLATLHALHAIGLATYAITILTYLIARYRAMKTGSVMEEAVVRVEFETRMRDVLMAVVGGSLWVAVRGGGGGGVRQPTPAVVRRVGWCVGVVVGVYVGAVRGVDGVGDWVEGWL